MSAGLARIAVLISGSGTNLQALIDAQRDPEIDTAYEIVAVGSDRPGAQGLDRATRAGIPTFVAESVGSLDGGRDQWDHDLADALSEHDPDWVVSAGFMKIIGPRTLERFPSKIINTHPALLPSFPGAHGVEDALAYGVRVTGCTVHIVDSGVDTGPILAQASLAVNPDDDAQRLHERIKEIERPLLLDVINRLCTTGVTVNEREVSF